MRIEKCKTHFQPEVGQVLSTAGLDAVLLQHQLSYWEWLGKANWLASETGPAPFPCLEFQEATLLDSKQQAKNMLPCRMLQSVLSELWMRSTRAWTQSMSARYSASWWNQLVSPALRNASCWLPNSCQISPSPSMSLSWRFTMGLLWQMLQEVLKR